MPCLTCRKLTVHVSSFSLCFVSQLFPVFNTGTVTIHAQAAVATAMAKAWTEGRNLSLHPALSHLGAEVPTQAPDPNPSPIPWRRGVSSADSLKTGHFSSLPIEWPLLPYPPPPFQTLMTLTYTQFFKKKQAPSELPQTSCSGGETTRAHVHKSLLAMTGGLVLISSCV